MDSFNELSLMEYTRSLASKSPVPGGGGAAALTAALAVSLGHMVGALTVGKQKYAAVQDEMEELMQRGESLRQRLLSLSDRDAEVFAPLAAAYRLPKETEEERQHKVMVLEQALHDAALVPMDIMKTCMEVTVLLEEFVKKGSSLAVSDAGCGAALIEAAIKSAALNVTINTKLMKDRTLAKSLNTDVLDIMTAYTAKAQRIYQSVYEELITQ